MSKGQIVKIISNLYTVLVDGKKYECRSRGRFRNENIEPTVGDMVLVDLENNYIMEILPRTTILKRPVIANVKTALIVTSLKKPDLSLNLLDKQISYLIINNIEPVIILTKKDLLNKIEINNIKEIFKYYKKLGIKVFYNYNTFKIKHYLKNKLVVVTGQTGAGKSTLINKLGKYNIETNEISEALGRGKHTTRHVEIYEVGKIRIADTPGFSALDLGQISKEEIRDSFIEFKKYTCDFKNCLHYNERKCMVKDHVGKEIMPSRYENYIKFIGGK